MFSRMGPIFIYSSSECESEEEVVVETSEANKIPIRTKNDSEGFNNRLNSSNSINMNMYRLIDVLYNESILVETVCRVFHLDM